MVIMYESLFVMASTTEMKKLAGLDLKFEAKTSVSSRSPFSFFIIASIAIPNSKNKTFSELRLYLYSHSPQEKVYFNVYNN